MLFDVTLSGEPDHGEGSRDLADGGSIGCTQAGLRAVMRVIECVEAALIG